MKNDSFKLLLIILILLCNSFGETVTERKSFNIPLMKLKLTMNQKTGSFQKITLYINSVNEKVEITRFADYHIMEKRRGRKTIKHPEPAGRAFFISDFEAKYINLTVESLISTLEIFESDLKRQNWEKLLYLDAFFPRFLKSFYYLVCAARNSADAFPRIAKLPDRLYDVSLNSDKSVKRIDNWKNNKEYIIKLRIISKELIYQLEKWQKKELDSHFRKKGISYSAKVEESYALFIRMYFNIKPAPELPNNIDQRF